MADYGQDILNDGLDRLNGTWEYQNVEYELVVKDISYPDFQLAQQYAALSQQVSALQDREDVSEEEIRGLNEQAESLDDFSWENDGDADFIPSMVEEKLVKPEVELSETNVGKLRALVAGMMETWQAESGVSEAQEEMPLEGNP